MASWDERPVSGRSFSDWSSKSKEYDLEKGLQSDNADSVWQGIHAIFKRLNKAESKGFPAKELEGQPAIVIEDPQSQQDTSDQHATDHRAPSKEDAAQSMPRTANDLDWNGPDDPMNPLNWRQGKKIYHTFIPSVIALVCTTASSIITPGLDEIQSEFGVSAEVSLLPYVLYVLGLSFGPLLSGPCSEHFGRRAVYLMGIPTFALFTLGAGFSQSIASLTICRFFAGVFGSPGLTIGGATLSDMWRPQERAIPWALYITTPFLGPAIGPLIGGYVILGKGWRWTQWTILFFTAAGLTPTLWMKETYKSTILRRKAKKDRIVLQESQRTYLQGAREFASKLVVRPIHMACVEWVVGLFTIYIALNFGMLYAFFAAFPEVFATAYGFGIGQTGLTFLGLGVGCIIGCALMIFFSRTVFKRQAVRARERGQGELGPENRLYLAMIGSICLPVSLFWFGWSVHARVHWVCPVIAEAVFGMGNLLIFMSATLYVNQTYGPLYGASAQAANSIARYLLSAAFPLFIVQMYDGLGVGWATSLLGFITLVMMPIPFVFYKLGPRLREHSQYTKS